MQPILETKGLSKHFSGVKALNFMNLELFPGEVHILAGENGAGKSTLVKCIQGYLKPDEGSIFLRGSKVTYSSPREALAGGIAVVCQELALIPWLDAAENIFFNREPAIWRTGIIRSGRMHRDAERILSELGCDDINVSMPVCKLGIAGRQMVEIAKALSMNPGILILDEPTAALSQKEADILFRRIRQLKKQGVAILYISHRMQEYRMIGDRVTVMRDGRLIGTGRLSDYSDRELVRMMVGREIEQLYHRRPAKQGDKVLSAASLCDLKGKVKNISFHISRGEIVGLAGLVGSGRTELADLIFGMRSPASGSVLLHGEEVLGKTSHELVSRGLGLLPEDRKGLGLAVRSTISRNITSVGLSRIFPDGLVRKKKEDAVAGEYMDKLGIAAAGADVHASSLSGGNQQKLVLAKWLCANTDVIIFDEPTRGIDVGAKAEIYQLMDRMAGEGKGILMISSELPELTGMCDRIYVMREGEISGELSRPPFDQEEIGKLMFISNEPDNAYAASQTGDSRQGSETAGKRMNMGEMK